MGPGSAGTRGRQGDERTMRRAFIIEGRVSSICSSAPSLMCLKWRSSVVRNFTLSFASIYLGVVDVADKELRSCKASARAYAGKQACRAGMRERGGC